MLIAEYESYLRSSMAGDFEECVLQYLLVGEDPELVALISNSDHFHLKSGLQVALISVLGFRECHPMFEVGLRRLRYLSVLRGATLSPSRIDCFVAALSGAAEDLDPLFDDVVRSGWQSFALGLSRRLSMLRGVEGVDSDSSIQRLHV